VFERATISIAHVVLPDPQGASKTPDAPPSNTATAGAW